MRYPQYRLHKTLSSVKSNLLKIFPLVSSDFRIHIVRKDARAGLGYEVNGREDNKIHLGTLVSIRDN